MNKIAVLILAGLISGCALFNKPVSGLPFDISVVLSLPNGDQLIARTDDKGVHIQGQYVSPKTGIIYKADENGTVSATWTDPVSGMVQSVMLTPKGN